MRIDMEIKGLMVDPITNMPIVILQGKDGTTILPIWVGIFEANAIALQMEKIATPRPMTHDLLRDVIGSLEASVSDITVTDLRDNTFYAVVNLDAHGTTIRVDSRPSDAIALALRTGARIYVEQEVIEKARTFDVGTGDAEKLKSWFENLNPGDLGKYEM